MSLELIAWNPRKKRKGRKARKNRGGTHGSARTRRRRRRRSTAAAPAAQNGGRTMAKKKGRKGRRRGRRTFTANTSTPPASGRRRRHSGGGGRFSLRSAFNVRQILGSVVQGSIVGAAVFGSNVATQKLVGKIKPDLAANPYAMSAAQVGIGILGEIALGMMGLRKYASSWMTGSVAGAALNAYGAWQVSRASSGNSQQTMSGMRGLAGVFGPASSPGFAPAGISRNAYASAG